MRSHRTDATLAATLLATIVLLDLLWSLLGGSTGTIVFGIADEPAHIATCAIVLLVAAALTRSHPPQLFLVAALVASVAIDLDHIPGYLGSHVLSGSVPRPYCHSLVCIVALAATGVANRRPALRLLFLGLSLGVAAHLLRDLATGPGVALLWPITTVPIRVPYEIYVGTLMIGLLAFVPRRVPVLLRGSVGLLVVLTMLAATAPRLASAHRIAMGVYIRGIEDNPGLLDQYTEMVGRPPSIVGSFKRWDVPAFKVSELREISSRGAIPMVSWEPWNATGHGYRLSAIAHGHFDHFLRTSALEAKQWGGPILLRFGQEMNGSWETWQRGVNGTTGPRFVAAWRHMVRIFRRAGARNVKWVWCPYVDNGRLPFMHFYPGGRWVDWVALDGYNWGSPIAWQSFSTIFDRSYRKLTKVTNKPLMIAEIGSNEAGGNKARWLRRTLHRQLPRLKAVRAVVWFDAVDRADFRVDSSPAALAAFRNGIRAKRYSGNRSWLLRLLEGSRHGFGSGLDGPKR